MLSHIQTIHITRSRPLHTRIKQTKITKHTTHQPQTKKNAIQENSSGYASKISALPRHPFLPRITRTSHIHNLRFAHPGIIPPTRISRCRALVRQRATLVVLAELSLRSRASGSRCDLAVIAVLLAGLLLWLRIAVVVLLRRSVFVALRRDGRVGCWARGLVWGGGCVCCWA